MLSTKSAKRARWKIKITCAERYKESNNLFPTTTCQQCILTINQQKENIVDRICKVQLSDENKILIGKSMLKRFRKYKCCVFIDFEYTSFNVMTTSSDSTARFMAGRGNASISIFFFYYLLYVSDMQFDRVLGEITLQTEQIAKKLKLYIKCGDYDMRGRVIFHDFLIIFDIITRWEFGK